MLTALCGEIGEGGAHFHPVTRSYTIAKARRKLVQSLHLFILIIWMSNIMHVH